jgi:adenylosuccinate synthase
MKHQQQAILVIDLAFGDCGKGAVVDYLTRRHAAHTVVRFNGGPQAGHNVVTPDGRHHTFSQFTSGTFVPGVRTLLSRFMLVEPYAMLNEASHLARVGVPDATSRLMIDRRCVVITPAHQAANRLREIARGDAAHGTCGMGVGETMQDLLEHPELAIHAGDLSNGPRVAAKLRRICEYKAEQLKEVIAAAESSPAAQPALETLLRPIWIDTAVEKYAQVASRASILDESSVGRIFQEQGTLIFEGAQGVLLDEWFGFHPHTTWSTTTFANAQTLLDENSFEGRRTRVGVLRTYFTRHGPGPFITEDPTLRSDLPEPHNADAGWQGQFRVGAFDAVAARYALAVAGGADWLALTHLDRLAHLPPPPRICTGYRLTDPPAAEDARHFFTQDAGVIRDIRVHRPSDLLRQERLTQLLRRCRPVTTLAVGRGAEGFMKLVERELGTPIRLTGCGPSGTNYHENKSGASACAARRPSLPSIVHAAAL